MLRFAPLDWSVGLIPAAPGSSVAFATTRRPFVSLGRRIHMPQTKLYTLEEYHDMPEFEHYELVLGVPTALPIMPWVHGYVQARLTVALGYHVDANRLGTVLSEKFLTHRDPDTVRIPDIMFVAREALVGTDMMEDPALFKATLAIEVISKGKSRRYTLEKIAEYFRVGVLEGWIVDQRRKTVTTHRPNGETRTYIETDVLDGGDVLPGFRYPLAQLFAKPDFG
jgi:Uma2 family endonuclease